MMDKNNLQFNKIAIFQKKEIRKSIHDGEKWFVINDAISALIEDTELTKGWGQIATPFL